MSRWPDKFKLPLVAMLLLGMGMFFLYMLGQIDTLHCERRAGDASAARCAIKTTWMNLAPLRQQELGTLRQAQLQDSCDSEGCTYRVYLETDRGGVALSSMYNSDRNGQMDITEQVNHFLASSSQPVLNVSTGGGWFLIMPIVLLLAGLVVTVSAFRALLNPTE